MSSEKVLLGKANVQQCEIMRQMLSGHGIEIVTIHNKSTCTSGCSTEMEIWAHPDDAVQISNVLKETFLNNLNELGYDTALLNAVYDENESHATCPACATVFSTALSECPECELAFGDATIKKQNCASGKCGP